MEYFVTQVQNLPRHSLLSNRHAVSQYTRVCNFVYANKKSTSFTVPILPKHENIQSNYCIAADFAC